MWTRRTQSATYLVSAFVLSLSVIALSSPVLASRSSETELTIYTVNYPLKYLAERIAGEHATVVFPAPGGCDPAYWAPTPEHITAYQSADIILLNGATYARWITWATLPQSRIVNTSRAFKEDYIEIVDGMTHSHGTDGEHSHYGTASTTWLDFKQAAIQAEAILEALSLKQPQRAGIFESNFRSLEKDLLALDEEVENIASKKQDLPLVASHPVYQYFTRRYGLNLESVMWEPEEMPSEELWEELEYGLQAHPAAWMIWDGEQNPDSVDRLLKLGIRSIVFDPCSNVPEEGDFLTVMRENVKNLRTIFE